MEATHDQFVENLFTIFLSTIQKDEENYNRDGLQYAIEDRIKNAIRPHIHAIHESGDILEASQCFIFATEVVFDVAS